jgi:5-methylcytosine-specific restriction endonuclease McrA
MRYCECGSLSRKVGTKKDGSIKYGKRCSVCHDIHYGIRPYLIHQKSYCENVDGRLGFVCTSTIVNQKQLTVDHINGRNVIDPHGAWNCQTLCHNCHIMKTHNDFLKRNNYDMEAA